MLSFYCNHKHNQVFFTKMAFLISTTIVTSFVFSVGYYMAQLALVGPEGNFGNVKVVFSYFFKQEPVRATGAEARRLKAEEDAARKSGAI